MNLVINAVVVINAPRPYCMPEWRQRHGDRFNPMTLI